MDGASFSVTTSRATVNGLATVCLPCGGPQFESSSSLVQFGAALFLHLLLLFVLFHITVMAATSFSVVILCTDEGHALNVAKLILLFLEPHLHEP
jgi:hypothetical protein